MRTAEIIALAKAAGLDLTGIPPAPRPFPPGMTPEVLARGAGIPDIELAAARFAYAGDRTLHWRLHEQLLHQALQLRRAHQWPAQVKGLDGAGRFYLESLAQLVLDEETNPHLFKAAPALYGLYVGVSDAHWHKSLEGRYGMIRAIWLGWLQTAGRIVQPGLVGDGHRAHK